MIAWLPLLVATLSGCERLDLNKVSDASEALKKCRISQELPSECDVQLDALRNAEAAATATGISKERIDAAATVGAGRVPGDPSKSLFARVNASFKSSQLGLVATDENAMLFSSKYSCRDLESKHLVYYRLIARGADRTNLHLMFSKDAYTNLAAAIGSMGSGEGVDPNDLFAMAKRKPCLEEGFIQESFPILVEDQVSQLEREGRVVVHAFEFDKEATDFYRKNFEFHRLNASVSPAEAQVVVRDEGGTQQEIGKLKPGKYTIEVSADRHRPHTGQFEVDDRDATYTVNLARSYSVVDCVPAAVKFIAVDASGWTQAVENGCAYRLERPLDQVESRFRVPSFLSPFLTAKVVNKTQDGLVDAHYTVRAFRSNGEQIYQQSGRVPFAVLGGGFASRSTGAVSAGEAGSALIRLSEGLKVPQEWDSVEVAIVSVGYDAKDGTAELDPVFAPTGLVRQWVREIKECVPADELEADRARYRRELEAKVKKGGTVTFSLGKGSRFDSRLSCEHIAFQIRQGKVPAEPMKFDKDYFGLGDLPPAPAPPSPTAEEFRQMAMKLQVAEGTGGADLWPSTVVPVAARAGAVTGSSQSVGSPVISDAVGRVLTAREVYDRARASVVEVRSVTREGVAHGSGVVIDRQTVATNCHVVRNATSTSVIFGGIAYEARVSKGSEAFDYCILTASGLPAEKAEVGSITSVAPGQRVYSVGAPKGLELTIAEGIVSGLRKEGGFPLPLIQTTAAISPGSSGGGLFDQYGRAIGVTVGYLEGGQNLNFALPIELSERLPQAFPASP